MVFQVDILFQGFSGKLEVGYMGWGTWALIRDGTHNILLDTGFAGLRSSYSEILKQYGLTPSDIDYVLLTHLHFDHARNVDLLPQARFVVSQKEWIYANNPDCQDLLVEKTILPILAAKKLILVNDGDKILPGITAMLTPGHTPGCCSYLLQQPDGSIWVLAGDAAKNRGELCTGTAQISRDPKQTAESLNHILRIASRVLPGHDGWITIHDGKVTAEGGNDKKIVFTQGITINGGETEITLHMD